MSKVVALELSDEPKTLSLTNIRTLTTSMPRLVPLTLAPRWAPIFVNSMKITPIRNLMCGASDNQAIKTKCMEQL